MPLDISIAQKMFRFKVEQLIAVKKFDGKKSLYFISNTLNDRKIKFYNQHTFNLLEKKIEEYEALLKDQKEKAEFLKKELKNK